MSNTKIVIDKEDFEQKIIGWIERRDYVTKSDILALFQGLTTEIQIDQSIEDRAKKYSETNCYGLEEHDEGGYLGINEKELANKLVEFATSQQIIEQLIVKELRKWIIDNSNEINIIDIINKIAELTNGKK